MRIGCGQACACLSSCFQYAKQSFMATILTLDKIRSNPETFQKTCIVVQSAIQGFNFYRGTDSLPRLVHVLEIAHSFDFYGICRLPRYIFHPYTADQIDEMTTLDQLETILCANWQRGVRDPEVRHFAKTSFLHLLEQMDDHDDDVRTEEDFKKLLESWLAVCLERHPKDGFDPARINLQDLAVPLKKAHILETLGDVIFIVIDIACFPAFLQDWSLVDLSFISKRMGSFAALATLDEWIMGGMCVGYLMNFLEAFRRVFREQLTLPELRNEMWVMTASTLDFLYNFAMLQQRDPRLIIALAFFAKLAGIIQIVSLPKPSFFQPE